MFYQQLCYFLQLLTSFETSESRIKSLKMSDIENSGGDDDSVAVSKKNGTSALKENNVAKIIPKSGLDDNKMDVDVDDHNHSDAAGNKLNGSSSPKKLPGKQHHVMNGGSSIDGDDDDDDEDVANGKSSDDGETSHLVTDDDSVQEATPSASSLSSPRKAGHARNDDYR